MNNIIFSCWIRLDYFIFILSYDFVVLTFICYSLCHTGNFYLMHKFIFNLSMIVLQLIDELLIEQMTNSSAIIEQAYSAKIYADFLKVS